MILNFGAAPARQRTVIFHPRGGLGYLGDPTGGLETALHEKAPDVIRDIENHHDGYVVRGAMFSPGFELHANEYVRSPQQDDTNPPKFVAGTFNLLMRDDGDLVLYQGDYGPKGGNAVWHTGTSGHPGAFFAFQGDGNMVVYDANMKPLWDSGTYSDPTGRTTLRFWVQSDGNLTLYDSRGETWGPDGRNGPYRYWTREPGATFWQTVGSIASAIPALAIAPIALPTAGLISLAATPVTGDPFKIVTEVSEYAATHPLETIAITAGAAGAAYGVGLIAPTVVAAASSAGAAGTAGAAATVVGTGATVAKAAGVLPSSSGASTTPAKTPTTAPVSPSTQPVLQAGMADLKLPVLIIAGAAGLALLLAQSGKRRRK